MTTQHHPRDPLLDEVAALLGELEASGVTELEVSAGGTTLFIRRRSGARPALEPVAAQPAFGSAAPVPEEGLIDISTPLSGVFYASPAPEEPAYVQPGDEVEAGQVVALVEAMKVFNEIHAEVAGTVVDVLVNGGQLVQSGQALMRLRPASGTPAGAADGEAV